MANEPSWDEIVGGGPSQATASAPPPSPERARRPRRRGLIWLLIIVAVVVGAGVAVTATVWTQYEDQLRRALGWELPYDYDSAGNGEEIVFTIVSGDTGDTIATNLAEEGVTMSYRAFFELLLERPEVVFQPGSFRLEGEMSAEAALEAILDPANEVRSRATIPEGVTAERAFNILAESTDVPVEELRSAASDLAGLGLPAEAPSIEGYLFPATYEFDPGVGAEQIVGRLVDRTFQALDRAGVAPEDRHRVLTIASLIEREARIEDDFYRVSRVIQNRLDIGMRLEFDSTSQYGSGFDSGSVWSSAEELDAENDYNTYRITGLPIGPIALPGDRSIDAALNPAEGPWIFFVTVNLETGQTQFSTTLAEHEQGVAQLRAWCREPGNESYCG